MKSVGAAILLLFLLAACSASPPAVPTPATPDASGTVAQTPPGDTPQTVELNITASQFNFDPGTITVKKGTHLILHLTSTDVRHGFGIAEYGQNVQFDKGEVKTLDFVADKAGTFTFHCTVPCGPGHMEMQGTLIVQ